MAAARDVLEINSDSYLGFFPTGRFAVGSSVTVTLDVNPSFKKGKTRFTVNFITGPMVTGNVLDDKALHFNVRPKNSTVVLNTYMNHAYGTEELINYDPEVWRSDDQPKSVVLKFVASSACIEISINDKLVHRYRHRLNPIDSIANNEWEGGKQPPVTVKTVEFTSTNAPPSPGVSMIPPPQQYVPPSSMPLAPPPYGFDVQPTPAFDAMMGKPSYPSAPSPRGAPPVGRKNQRTEIEIYKDQEDSFLAAAISVAKDIQEAFGDRMGKNREEVARMFNVMFQPLPYTAPVDRLYTGRGIYATLTPLNSHNAFSINLYNGPDDIAFHMAVRMADKTIRLNSKLRGTWQKEEQFGHMFPFTVGTATQIIIMCGQDEFNVALNGQHAFSFRYRVAVQSIDSVSVEGDARLIHFQV